jgi:predicted nuclease of predicted toxin-antitoxin system
MRLYLDDDSASGVLARLLQNAGHDVQVPTNAGLAGADDSVHLTHAIRDGRVLLSQNDRDFQNLHDLIMQAGGHHPGILVVRRDNDPTRDMAPAAVVRAIRKLEATGLGTADCYHILNHWR